MLQYVWYAKSFPQPQDKRSDKYEAIKKSPEALIWLQKALEIIDNREEQLDDLKAAVLRGLSLLYISSEQYDKSIRSAELALEVGDIPPLCFFKLLQISSDEVENIFVWAKASIIAGAPNAAATLQAISQHPKCTFEMFAS